MVLLSQSMDTPFKAQRVRSAMASIAPATWSPELRDEAYELYARIEDDIFASIHGNTDDDTDDDMAEHDVELLPDLKPRVLIVLQDFLRSSSFDASNPSFADIKPLLQDMLHAVPNPSCAQ